MERQSGTHPTTGEANKIVFDACAPEFPNANLADTVGDLYPLSSQRTIFVDRVVDNTKTAGFTIDASKVPSGDTDTLGAVSNAVVNNAAA